MITLTGIITRSKRALGMFPSSLINIFKISNAFPTVPFTRQPGREDYVSVFDLGEAGKDKKLGRECPSFREDLKNSPEQTVDIVVLVMNQTIA